MVQLAGEYLIRFLTDFLRFLCIDKSMIYLSMKISPKTIFFSRKGCFFRVKYYTLDQIIFSYFA